MSIANLAPGLSHIRRVQTGAVLVLSALAYLVTNLFGAGLLDRIESASGPLVAALLEKVDVGRSAPGHVAETIFITLSRTLAALAPALASGAFARRWRHLASRMSGDFLMLLSASTAVVTLAYALWARRRNEESPSNLMGDILFGRVEPSTAPAKSGRKARPEHPDRLIVRHSTVTDFARFLGWSTSVPMKTAV